MKYIGIVLIAFISLFAPQCLSAQKLDELDRINQLAGLPFLQDEGKWSISEFELTLRRYGLYFQGSKSRRSAYLGNRRIFNIPAVEMLLISNKESQLAQIDIIYFNKGDSVNSDSLRRDIRTSNRALRQTLTTLMGKPEREDFGPRGMKTDVLVWEHNNVSFMLENSRDEYTILRVCYDKKSNKKQKRSDLQIHKQKYTDNVETDKNGDVYIENIPMVNQGNKGYCVPATVERILRYYGITQINMHQLADAADTRRGGGTTYRQMFSSIDRLCRTFGLKTKSGGEIKISMLEKYITQGIPVIWSMNSNPEFNQLMLMSRQSRPKNKSPKAWLKSLRKYKLPRDGGPHACLIVGFNEETDEIAISNSWGDHELIPAWIPLKLAARVSLKETYVLLPRR